VASLAEALTRQYARIPLGMRLGLEPMRAACARAGAPERAFRVAHVAGTNGKGSVCAMVESIARAAGIRTGMYTSPHLCRFAERIRIDGAPVTDEVLADLLTRALDDGQDLSFFETATLAAFLAFRDASVDLAVVEVGLGGRLDATNVVPCPAAAAITRIALDHMDRLGSTLVEIAREKAGIAKPGLELLLGDMPAEVRTAIDEVAHAQGATTASVGQAPLPATMGLNGAYQRDNARIAMALAARIGASPPQIAQGLAEARWPGRLERIRDVLLDGAHNPDGARALAEHVSGLGLPPQRVALVFGALSDKDWAGMLDVLAPLSSRRIYVAPQTASREPAAAERMAVRHAGAIASSVDEALDALAHGPERPPELVVICGSLILVGQARARLLGLPRDPPVAL
jgi:dihydrofolate synthase/folylpolyglutamate synthase